MPEQEKHDFQRFKKSTGQSKHPLDLSDQSLDQESIRGELLKYFYDNVEDFAVKEVNGTYVPDPEHPNWGKMQVFDPFQVDGGKKELKPKDLNSIWMPLILDVVGQEPYTIEEIIDGMKELIFHIAKGKSGHRGSYGLDDAVSDAVSAILINLGKDAGKSPVGRFLAKNVDRTLNRRSRTSGIVPNAFRRSTYSDMDVSSTGDTVDPQGKVSLGSTIGNSDRIADKVECPACGGSGKELDLYDVDEDDLKAYGEFFKSYKKEFKHAPDLETSFNALKDKIDKLTYRRVRELKYAYSNPADICKVCNGRGSIGVTNRGGNPNTPDSKMLDKDENLNTKSYVRQLIKRSNLSPRHTEVILLRYGVEGVYDDGLSNTNDNEELLDKNKLKDRNDKFNRAKEEVKKYEDMLEQDPNDEPTHRKLKAALSRYSKNEQVFENEFRTPSEISDILGYADEIYTPPNKAAGKNDDSGLWAIAKDRGEEDKFKAAWEKGFRMALGGDGDVDVPEFDEYNPISLQIAPLYTPNTHDVLNKAVYNDNINILVDELRKAVYGNDYKSYLRKILNKASESEDVVDGLEELVIDKTISHSVQQDALELYDLEGINYSEVDEANLQEYPQANAGKSTQATVNALKRAFPKLTHSASKPKY